MVFYTTAINRENYFESKKERHLKIAVRNFMLVTIFMCVRINFICLERVFMNPLKLSVHVDVDGPVYERNMDKQ